MEVKEIKKEYTLVFTGSEIKDLKIICNFYSSRTKLKSTLADDLADEIINLEL